MKGLAYVGVDYCCFSDWGYQKPTRIWGSEGLGRLKNIVCEKSCPSIVLNDDGVRGHRERLPVAGRRKLSGKELYRIPPSLVCYIIVGSPEIITESQALAAASQPQDSSFRGLGKGAPEIQGVVSTNSAGGGVVDEIPADALPGVESIIEKKSGACTPRSG